MTQDSIDKLSNDCKFEIRARYGKCTTRVPVDQAPAGPALDAAISIALGYPGYFSDYVCINGKRCDIRTWILEGFTPEEPSAGHYAGKMPCRYSTDIAAAWELANLEKMAVIPLTNGMWSATPGAAMTEYWNDSKHKFTMRKVTMGYYERYLDNGSLSDTAPLAITRAYLKAKGVEWVEVPD